MAFRAWSARRSDLLLQPSLDRAALRVGLRVFPERWPAADNARGVAGLIELAYWLGATSQG